MKTTALALFVATIMLLSSVSAVDMAVETSNNNVIYDDKEVTTPSNSEFRAKDDTNKLFADFASANNEEKPSSIGRAIFEEGFEGGVMPPTGWLLDELNLVSPWGLVDATTHPAWVHSGEYAAWINYDTPNPSDNWLITPDIDLTGYTDGVEFQFWIVTNTNWVAYATLEVYINNGTGNTLLWNLNEETWPDFIYYQKTFNLDAYVDQVVNISFRYVGQDGNSLGLDDIILYEPTDDVGVVSIESPISGMATGAIAPEVTVKSFGPSDLVDVPVQLQIGYTTAAPGGYFNNFEADNGGFTGTGIWQWGTPTSGPMGAYSGVNLWATNLVGNYIAGLATLTTSAILIPAQAELSFWHWYYIETSYDGGNVKISTDAGVTWNVITPEGGYTGTANTANPLYPEPIFTGSAHQSWEQQIFDLSTYVGQTVQFRFDFGADGSVMYSGWYIDDVLIGTKQIVAEYDETMLVDIDAGETVSVVFPDWIPAAWHTVENADISYDIWAHTNLLTDTNPANDFLDDAALMHYGYFHDIATTVLNPEGGPAATLPVEVEIENLGQYPDGYFNVNAVVEKEFAPVSIFNEGFEGYSPQVDVFPPTGWSIIQTDPDQTWFKYLPTGLMRARCQESGSAGAQDEWLITGTIDCSTLTGVLMKYYRYKYHYTSNTDSYIEMLGSTDNGVTWPNLIYNYTSLDANYGFTEEYDLTSWAAGESEVKIAWRFVSTDDTSKTEYFYFDDLSISSIGTPLVTEDFETWGPYGDVPPAGWTILDFGDDPTPDWDGNDWYRYSYQGSYTARVYYSPVENQDEWLISPTINCSGITGTALSFDSYYNWGSTDYGQVMGSIDDGVTWTVMIENFTADDSWKTKVYDISSWADGQEQVKILFRYVANNDWYWYVDNFWVGYGLSTVMTEDFSEIIPESGFPPAGWGMDDIINMDSTIPPDPNIWRGATEAYSTTPTNVDPFSGDDMAIYDTGLLYPQGSEARLYTPAIPIFSPGAGIYRLEFMLHRNTYSSTASSDLVVEYSGDGLTWSDMETISIYDSTNPGWVLQEIDITAFAGYYVYFGFRGIDGGYQDVILDDISVKAYGTGAEYAESQLISDYIFPGETRTLTFPDWTPDDLPLLVSGTIPYTITSSHDLADGDATNDINLKSIELVYKHDVTVKDITEPSMGRNDDVFYAFNSYPGDDSVWFDPATPGVLNVIGPNTAPDFICAGTWADGTWYVGAYGGGIYTVDPNVGTMTLIGGTTSLNGMAYDGSTMYGATGTQLYEIDLSTGAATLIGSFGLGGTELMIDIAIDQDTGIGYGHDIVTDSIYTIDLSTGAATLLGSTGLSCNYAQGMEYDQDNDILYLSAYTAQGELYTCDTATGACTLVGAFQGGAEVCGLAIPYSGGGPGPGAADIYLAPGSQSFAAITENLGTFPELGLTANAELNAFNETGVPYLIYEEDYSDFDLDVGEEETATFGSYTFVDSEIYNLVIFLPLGVDDEPANNIKELTIAVDGVAPTSGHSLDPAAPNGGNGWYISEVTVTLSADDGSEDWQSGVDDIKYKIDGGSEMTYTDPFVVSTDGEHTVTYWAVDYVGNKEADNTVDFDIDTTGPTVDLTWEAGTEKNQIIFTATCADGLSGMDKVEFLYNDVVQQTDDTDPFTWTMTHGAGTKYTVKAIAYDMAGNSDFDEIGSGEGLNKHSPTPTTPTVQTTTPLIK